MNPFARVMAASLLTALPVVALAGGPTEALGLPGAEGSAARDRPPGAGGAADEGLTALSTLTDYLAAFARSYVTPLPERDGVAAAEAVLRDAGLKRLPRLSLRESLDHRQGGLELDLALDVDVPLYDATAAPHAATAAADLELRRLYAAAAREQALAALLHDLSALAVLGAAAERLPDAALVGVHAPEPLLLRPQEREAYEAALRARETAAWLSGTVMEVRERLSRRLGAPVSALAPPRLEDLEGLLRPRGPMAPRRGGSGAGRADDRVVAACLESSTGAQVARARHAHALRSADLDVAPDLSVTLAAGLDYSATIGGPAAGPGSGLAVSVGLEARYLLPPGRPLGGSLSASAGTDGVSQEVQLSWPASSVPSALGDDPDEQLADELHAAEAEARARLRSLAAARSERAGRERALAWALLDLAPDVPVAEAKRLAAEPLAAGWPSFGGSDDLALAELRLEAALARLGELSAAIDLAQHCGALPAAEAG